MAAEEFVKNSPDLASPQFVVAYFDESGKLAEDVISFGGCAGVPEQTQLLNVKWSKILNDAGIAFTSMKDAMYFQGPFRKWKDSDDGPAKRDELLLSLAKAIVETGMLIIASPMTKEEFSASTHQFRERFWHNLQYCCFEACVSGVLHKSANAVLHVTLDLSDEYAQKCIALFNKLRERDALVKARCFAISFADDKKHAGLQAADMIAYTYRAEHTERELPRIIQQIIALFKTEDRAMGALVYRMDSGGPGSGQITGL
jgi:hypothetical protein